MGKIEKNIAILAVGDRADYDSFKKLHKEKGFMLEEGFEYAATNYKKLLVVGAPAIKAERVIVFLFFPFFYWNNFIEHKGYKGIYGNRTFYRKFKAFWKRVNKVLKRSLKGKEVFFVNLPELCALYRDKTEVANRFSRAGIPSPEFYKTTRVKDVENLLNKGHRFFLKPRYGSMGKGITFLKWSDWQTNFIFKRDKIISRRSDRGWKFRNITGNRKFLSRLLKSDILMEKAVDSLLLKDMKVDMRIYTFFGKILYIYPRKNKRDKITTNISQGAKGDPSLLKSFPGRLVRKAKRIAVNVPKVLGLNFVGMDIMMDQNLKDVYVIDVNLFPGFPKRKTLPLAQYMVKELAGLAANKKIHFKRI